MRYFIIVCFCALAYSSGAQDCPDTCEIFVPNAVTPDCDGIDCEFLYVSSNCSFQEFHLMIFNRWGVLVFETEDPENEFDASTVNDGTYLWRVDLVFCNDQKLQKEGTFMVIK